MGGSRVGVNGWGLHWKEPGMTWVHINETHSLLTPGRRRFEEPLESGGSTFSFRVLSPDVGLIVVTVEGSGVITSSGVTKRVSESDGDIEINVQPSHGNFVVSYRQDGGGEEVLSKALLIKEGSGMDIGLVVSGVVGAVCLLSILG